MIESMYSSVAGFAAAAIHAFLLPGEWLLRGIAVVAPGTVEILTFGHGGIVVTFVLALMGWTVLVVCGLIISRFCRRIAWQLAAIVRSLLWRLQMFLGNFKTKLLWKYREFFPHKATGGEQVAQTEFEAADIAVLLRVARLGPAIATSAPDLAESLGQRPAQVQKRLEKLTHFKMLRSVIGSTDGFDNYSLTSSGEAYIAMIRRQAKSQPRVSPVLGASSKLSNDRL
jgi:DNA-binding MarR family transcriptional regulator